MGGGAAAAAAGGNRASPPPEEGTSPCLRSLNERHVSRHLARSAAADNSRTRRVPRALGQKRSCEPIVELSRVRQRRRVVRERLPAGRAAAVPRRARAPPRVETSLVELVAARQRHESGVRAAQHGLEADEALEPVGEEQRAPRRAQRAARLARSSDRRAPPRSGGLRPRLALPRSSEAGRQAARRLRRARRRRRDRPASRLR